MQGNSHIQISRRAANVSGRRLLVEVPNDRITLKSLGLDAFAISSNIITPKRASHKAQESGVPIGVMFDTDPAGENGARQSIPLLAQHGPVQYAWPVAMYGGQSKDRQAESLSPEEWQSLHNALSSPESMTDN